MITFSSINGEGPPVSVFNCFSLCIISPQARTVDTERLIPEHGAPEHVLQETIISSWTHFVNDILEVSSHCRVDAP